MSTDLSAIVQECHRRAADCGRRAEKQRDLKIREDLFVLERRWRMLARYYERRLATLSPERETTSAYWLPTLQRADH